MVRFLIYLFESGLCLTVMYLVYQFFLKRETYFGFNRMYLNAVVLVILLIPLLHISISVPNTERLESPVSQIFKFRNYYEQVIALTDPEYGAQYRERLAVDRDIEGLAAAGVEGTGMSAGTVSTGEAGRFDAGGPDGERGWHALHLSDVLLILYLLGPSKNPSPCDEKTQYQNGEKHG